MLLLLTACTSSIQIPGDIVDTGDTGAHLTPPLASADVVIIGGGASGLAAAMTARDAGATVLIIEREGELGGSGLYAGSYFAVETSWQADSGIEDSVELALEEWSALTGGGDPAHPWVENFLQDSADNLVWLTDFGAEFACGDEISGSSSVSRTHNLQANGAHPFVSLGEALRDDAWTLTTATGLVLADEAVIGVAVDTADGIQGWIEAGAVVVATGGFARNDSRVYAALPALKAVPRHAGSWHLADGNGLDLIEAAGGTLENMENIAIYGHSATDVILGAPETQLVIGIETGVVVNPSGQRMMDEAELREVWGGRGVLEHGQLTALFDETLWNQLKINGFGYNYMPVSDGSLSPAEYAEQGDIPQAQTIQELGALIGIDGEVLLGTVDDFNRMVSKGSDPDFGRDMSNSTLLKDAPFYALPIVASTGKSFGGAAISTRGEILDADAQAIAGLFAAGEVAGILGGDHIGMGFSGSISAILYTGRVAGEHAARYTGH